MRKLKFPSYEYIKSLPTYDEDNNVGKEYDWMLFDTPINIWGILHYKGGKNYIRFDFYVGGYTEDDFCWSGRLNEENYKKLCKHAQKVFESIYEALDEDCSKYWEYGVVIDEKE